MICDPPCRNLDRLGSSGRNQAKPIDYVPYEPLGCVVMGPWYANTVEGDYHKKEKLK